MNFINQSTIFFNSAQMMNASAYALQQSIQGEDTQKEKKAEKKGLKNLLKSLNPVKLFSKIFRKKEKELPEEEMGL